MFASSAKNPKPVKAEIWVLLGCQVISSAGKLHAAAPAKLSDQHTLLRARPAKATVAIEIHT